MKNLSGTMGDRCIGMIKVNGIRNHMLTNTARIHSGAVEEESTLFKKFLVSRNGCMIGNLEGKSVV